ncbi:hypothetical protein [Archangium sp.]|uniref:hypothetical protein n=1 Tax=Archangium sp. TaxID=1872627 RepID=UPI002D724EFC|nr:hypothetical protein [Archangium sp.]HYO56463.1 hypothetical protein [Archangium sp.]
MSSKSSHTTIGHDEIRRWAEERGGQPAMVKGTGGDEQTGIIRIDFPGYSEGKLEPISWDDFFQKFDESNLALVYAETTRGQKSNFNKLISRESVDLETGDLVAPSSKREAQKKRAASSKRATGTRTEARGEKRKRGRTVARTARNTGKTTGRGSQRGGSRQSPEKRGTSRGTRSRSR